MRISHAVLALATLVSVVACSAPDPVAPSGRAKLDGNATSSTSSDSTTVTRGLGWSGSGN
jgi:hypothetical protein